MAIISDYYIWFLVVGGSLLLITIGYLADQTSFGKKKISGGDSSTIEKNAFSTLEQQLGNSNVRINDVYSDIKTPVTESNVSQMETVSPIPDNVVSTLSQGYNPNGSEVLTTEINTEQVVMNSINNDELFNYDLNNQINENTNFNVNQNDNNIWKF